MTEETSHKIAIKQYLRHKGIFFYHNLAGMGVYPGVADITAISNGKCYQIEVKAKNGIQSEKQKQFQKNWEQSGGIYILGGIDEVIKSL